ncbi:hypothetical protein ACFWXO_05290 [Kitasatospora sp. NPDC059088]|uniref:hypothetical protein n=1 Tax=Kitasatospora sp. NPDC059088 TaxID=3346722 RepID=UPI0036C948E9
MTNETAYNDAAYNISSVPSWKAPPLHGAYAPNARLGPWGKAGLAAGAVVLAASGVFAWSHYASTQAQADAQKAQIALDQSRVDLQRQQLAADLAKSVEQETPAQTARRQAVQACVEKAAGSYNAITECGKAFPADAAPGMVNTAQKVAADGGDSSDVPVPGLVVLGGVGILLVGGWVKKRIPRT